MSAFGGKADIDQPLLANLDLRVHGLVGADIRAQWGRTPQALANRPRGSHGQGANNAGCESPQPSKSLKILIFLEQADEGFGTIVNGVATGSPPYRPTHWCLLVGRGVRKIEGWIWGIAHIYFLISLRNRLIVATQWLWPTSLSSAARG
jgi:hypothetical protein